MLWNSKSDWVGLSLARGWAGVFMDMNPCPLFLLFVAYSEETWWWRKLQEPWLHRLTKVRECFHNPLPRGGAWLPPGCILMQRRGEQQPLCVSIPSLLAAGTCAACTSSSRENQKWCHNSMLKRAHSILTFMKVVLIKFYRPPTFEECIKYQKSIL